MVGLFFFVLALAHALVLPLAHALVMPLAHANEPLTFPITFEAAFEEEGAIITRALEWKITPLGVDIQENTPRGQDESLRGQDESLRGQDGSLRGQDGSLRGQDESVQVQAPSSPLTTYTDTSPRPTFLLPLGRYTAIVSYG